MTGIKTFLPTDGANAGQLLDEDGNIILLTQTNEREAIAGARVPVDIGTRPNANDGDPLRTSFSKLNNFVLASYQNDSDIQERVGALEAGSIFLGMFRADQLPRRTLPLRDSGAGGAWIPSSPYPDDNGDLYNELRPEAVPDLETNVDATDVYAMISRPIEGSPSLSVIIDDIGAIEINGSLNIAIVFPSMITDESEPSDISEQLALGVPDSDPETLFPAVRASNVQIGDLNASTAQEIAEAIQDALIARVTTIGAGDLFTFNIEAPTEDTRRLIIDYNVRAVAGTLTLIPTMLFTIETPAGSPVAVDEYGDNLRASSTSNGNTRGAGIAALPWIDQDIGPDRLIIPAYTLFQWTRDGWSIADQGRGDINAEYLHFDDNERSKTLVRTSADASMDIGGMLVEPNTKTLSEDGTRDAIIETQQFGIDYIHNVTIDAGEY